MEYKYLLFDLDGTLTDPEAGITTSVQYALRSMGIEEPELHKLRPFIGPPLKESFMQRYGLSEAQSEEAIAKYREWFAPEGIFQNEIYPGIPELLKELQEAGKVLAVASSKPTVFVDRILCHFEIAEYFQVVVGSELNGVRGSKEEVVEEALKRLREQYETDGTQTVMIGDRRFDISGGKAHGLTTVGVTFGYAQEGELEAAGADYIVHSVKELGRLLMR